MADSFSLVNVELGSRSYSVYIGPNVIEQLQDVIPSDVRRVAIVTQAQVPVHLTLAIESKTFVIGNGEKFKSLETIQNLCSGFAEMGLTRNDLIIAVGGGMVTDVAGFAASVFHRGIRVIHVATTLLAMVDAAIGGKTGVNLPEGKNLVGAFWQPTAVFCELDALTTLPEDQMRGGVGELAKYHFISGKNFLAMSMQERITAAVQIKSDIVAADERESGQRALLNYGHTLGHAIEIAGGFRIQHGEAVAIGLIFAAHLAHELGRISQARVDDHYRVVGEEYGLSTKLPEFCDFNQMIELMNRDKKALTGLTFVLDGPNGLEVVGDVSEENVRAALGTMALR